MSTLSEDLPLSKRRGWIYALCDPRVSNLMESIFYIGQTVVSVKSRFECHIGEAKKGRDNPYRGNKIRKMLREGVQPTIRILEIVAWDKIDEEETRIIRLLRKSGKLTNITDGGDGFVGMEKYIREYCRSEKGKENLRRAALLSIQSRRDRSVLDPTLYRMGDKQKDILAISFRETMVRWWESLSKEEALKYKETLRDSQIRMHERMSIDEKEGWSKVRAKAYDSFSEEEKLRLAKEHSTAMYNRPLVDRIKGGLLKTTWYRSLSKEERDRWGLDSRNRWWELEEESVRWMLVDAACREFKRWLMSSSKRYQRKYLSLFTDGRDLGKYVLELFPDVFTNLKFCYQSKIQEDKEIYLKGLRESGRASKSTLKGHLTRRRNLCRRFELYVRETINANNN